MRLASAVLFVGAVFLFGSGLAALPYAENDPCIEFLTETGPSVLVTNQLIPYGTRCEAGAAVALFLGPSTGTYAAWLLATALVLAAAVRHRRSAVVRGVGSAIAVLGVFGVLAHQLDFTGAGMATLVLAAPW